MLKKYFFLLLACFLYRVINTANTPQKISDADVWEIYNNYVKPSMTNENKFRYASLPLEKNNTPWLWKGKDLPRVISYLEFGRFISDNNITCNKGLAIGYFDPEWYLVKSKKIIQTDYDNNKDTHDLHTLDLPEKDFDFVMCCHILEHVCDPISCLKQIYKHMRDGGILYVVAPGNNIPHCTPFHFYTGFTPTCFGAMVRLAGFKILSIGQWGNLEYLTMMHQTNSWPDYVQFTGKIINDLNCSPLTVWGICKQIIYNHRVFSKMHFLDIL